MAKQAQTKTPKTTQKSRARKSSPKRDLTRTAKVDELKLGKFNTHEPMCLPESPVRRSWQIIGGIALLLITGFCLVSMVTQVPFAYLWQTETDLWQAELTPLTISWIVNNIALVIFTIFCLIASLLLFMRRRVPTGIWYILILSLVIGFISQSIGIYQNYTTRECVEASCPMVVGELSVVLLCDLTIFMLSILLLWMVFCMNKHRYHHKSNQSKSRRQR